MLNKARDRIIHLHNFLKKRKGVIQTKTIQDVADLVAIAEGFKSWNAYKRSLAKEEVDVDSHQESEPIRSNLFVNKEINCNDIGSFLVNGNTYPEKRNKTHGPKSLPNEYLIGHRKINKSKNPVGLRMSDTLIVGENRDFKNNTIEWIEKQKVNAHVLSIDCSKRKTAYNIVGKNNLRLDPIAEMLLYQKYDMLLSKSSTAGNEFDYILVSLLNLCYEDLGFNWNTRMILELGSIEGVLKVYQELNKKGHYYAKALMNYLQLICGVKEDGGVFFISARAQEKHSKSSLRIMRKVAKIDRLYRLGYFREGSGVYVEDMINGQNGVYYDVVGKEIERDYFEVVHSLYYHSKMNKKDGVLGDDRKKLLLFWLNADLVFDSRVDSHGGFVNFYCVSNACDVDLFAECVDQVLFLEHVKSDSVWLRSLIKYMENINYNVFSLYREMNKGEAVLWVKQVGYDDDFIIKYDNYKFNLYS